MDEQELSYAADVQVSSQSTEIRRIMFLLTPSSHVIYTHRLVQMHSGPKNAGKYPRLLEVQMIIVYQHLSLFLREKNHLIW
jgi:hypothetical protein